MGLRLFIVPLLCLATSCAGKSKTKDAEPVEKPATESWFDSVNLSDVDGDEITKPHFIFTLVPSGGFLIRAEEQGSVEPRHSLYDEDLAADLAKVDVTSFIQWRMKMKELYGPQNDTRVVAMYIDRTTPFFDVLRAHLTLVFLGFAQFRYRVRGSKGISEVHVDPISSPPDLKCRSVDILVSKDSAEIALGKWTTDPNGDPKVEHERFLVKSRADLTSELESHHGLCPEASVGVMFPSGRVETVLEAVQTIRASRKFDRVGLTFLGFFWSDQFPATIGKM